MIKIIIWSVELKEKIFKCNIESSKKSTGTSFFLIDYYNTLWLRAVYGMYINTYITPYQVQTI